MNANYTHPRSRYSRTSLRPPEPMSTGLGASGLRPSGPGVSFDGSCFTTWVSSSGLTLTGLTTTGMKSRGLMASGFRFAAWLLILSNEARLFWPVSSKQEMNKGRAWLPRVSRSVISCLAWSRRDPEPARCLERTTGHYYTRTFWDSHLILPLPI